MKTTLVTMLFVLFVATFIFGFLTVTPARAIGEISEYTIDNRLYIRDIFVRNYEGSLWRDALYFLPEDYQKLSVAEIEAMEQERFDNWLKFIHTPPPPDPISVPEFGGVAGFFAVAGCVLSYLIIRHRYNKNVIASTTA